MNEKNKNNEISKNLTLIEKLNLLNSSFILSLISLCLLFVELAISLLFFFVYLHDNFLFYMIGTNIVVILAVFLFLIWLKSLKHKYLYSGENLKEQTKPFAKIGFLIVFILLMAIFLKTIFTIFLYYQKTFYENAIMAVSDELTFKAFYSEFEVWYNIYISIETAFLFLHPIIQCFILYAIIANSFNLSNFRNLFVCFQILLSFFGFWALYYSKITNDYFISFQNSDNLINSFLVNTIFFGTIFYIILGLSGLIINITRWKTLYLIFGTLNLIFSLIFLTSSSMILKNSSSLQEMYSANCPNLIRLFSQDYLINIECPYKYKTNINNGSYFYSVDCPINEVGTVWDNFNSTDYAGTYYKLACLNYDCCGVLAESLVKAFILLGLSTFLMSLLGFAISSVSFFLSVKSNVENKYYSQKTELFKPSPHFSKKGWTRKYLNEIIALVFFGLFCVGFIILSHFSNSMLKPQDSYYPSILSEINTFQISKSYSKISIQKSELSTLIPKKLSSGLKLYSLLSNSASNSSFCNNMTDALNGSSLLGFIEGATPISIVRIALLVINSKFAITFNFSLPTIKLYNVNLDKYKSIFFPNVSSNSDFILFEGGVDDILPFLDKCLKICSYPYAKTQILYIKYIRTNTESNNGVRRLELKNHKITKESSNHHDSSSSGYPTISSKAANVFNTYTWAHLSGVVYDSDSKNTLANVKLSLIPWINNKCNFESSDVVHKQETNNEGKSKFFNIIRKSYTLIFTKSGYKTNCISIDFAKNETEKTFLVVMVKEFFDAKYYVTLEYNNYLMSNETNFNLQLQATYTQNGKSCYSSLFEKSCRGMFSNNTEYFGGGLVFQKIGINTILSTKYLFFLQKLPLENYKNLSKSSDEYFNNTDIIEANPTIKIYSADVDSPISLYYYPFYDNPMRNLVWLIFCLDGSFDKLDTKGKIWMNSENSLEYGNVTLPSSSYCSS